MAKLISKLLLTTIAIASSSCSVANEDTKAKVNITFDNTLSQCISVNNYSTQKVKNTTLLDFEYTTKHSIAHCGCKSALMQYRVIKPHQELASGLINFRDRDAANITLSNTSSLLDNKQITVSFTCSQPQ